VPTSAIPGNTTVVPNRVRKPSAAEPQRPQARHHEQTLSRPLAQEGGQVGNGSDVGQLVKGEQCGWQSLSRPFSLVRGVAHIAEGGDDEWSELVLPSTGGADVHGVDAATELGGVEWRELGRLQRGFRSVGRQDT
jgi:hypothetical protein